MANFLDALRKIVGVPLENAGESSTPIPKAPAFKTPDPIYVEINKMNVDVDTKQRLWERYQADDLALPEDMHKEWRRDLGRDKSFRKMYVDELLERDKRGESLSRPYRGEEATPIIPSSDDLLNRLRETSGVGRRRTR